MNPGIIATWVAFLAALGSAAAFLLWGQGKARFAPVAKALYVVQAVTLLGMSAWLVNLFLGHRYEYAYIANYSSRAMDMHYVLAAFWGGQEGTFLLWALWSTGLAALLLCVKSRLVPTAMFFANWAPIFLLFILTVQSPFRLLPTPQPDGAGLNPLLQDWWMTIHPPTLFLGYASLILPFALAMSTLVHRDEKAWVRSAPPFVLLSTVILGTGFTMGGLWAYKVLGWGGFWGWDPVENASLVPWLFNVALLHGLLVQRATGALARTNLFLAITSFMFVLYGSFLTRSGVLADFSVHSFVDLGLSGYLLAFMGFFGVLGYGTWALRQRGFAHQQVALGAWSREFALWLGMIVFCLMAILTMAGTSAPLISRLFGEPGNVQIDYYRRVNAPLGLLISILVALGPMVRWRQESPSGMGKRALPSAIAGLVAAALAVAFGMRDPLDVLLVFGALFALVANLQVTLKASRRGISYAAGYVSHLGLSILLVGVLAYTTFGRAKQIALPQGKTVEVLGYQMRYDGKRPQPDGKDKVSVAVSKDGHAFEAQPVIYFSAFSQGMMRNPHVERGVTQDLYIAPIELQAGEDALPSVRLAKGQAGEAGGFALAFQDFEREGEMGDPNGFKIRARVQVGTGATAAIVRPAVKVTPYGLEKEPAEIPGGGALTLVDVDPGTGTAQLAVLVPGAAAASEVLAVEVSTKPLIGLVWIGMGLLLGGAGLGIARRLALRRQEAFAHAGAMAHAPAEP